MKDTIVGWFLKKMIMAWIKKHSRVYEGVSCSEVWDAWVDLKNWHLWNPGIEKAWINGEFKSGNSFFLKPVSFRNPVKIEIVDAIVGERYVDKTSFFLAAMYGEHFVEKTDDGVKLKTIVKVEGLLKYFWIWLVASKVASKMEKQTNQLIDYIKKQAIE